MKSSAFLLMCLLLAVPCTAEIITVDDDGMADFNSIQSAINFANNGDIIIIQPSIYIENISIGGKNIILTSVDIHDPNVVEGTVIEGHSFNTPVIILEGTETSDSEISGLTITGGDTGYGDTDGGGITGNKALTKITNCIIRGNSGGGLGECDGAITGCIISDNFIGKHGGGLYKCNGIIKDCMIVGNSAIWSAGGLYRCDGEINNCIISNNRGYCGGLAGCFETTIKNCIITNNIGEYKGGGLKDCHGIISGCLISGNYAEIDGGGFYDCDGVISNCIITGNRARNNGGGCCRGAKLYNSEPKFINCSIIGNIAGETGGGLYNYYDHIINCIIWNNLPGQIVEEHISPLVSYSNVQYSWPGVGNIDNDPCFVDSGYWDPNGTPSDVNDDFWVDGDYHLKSEGWRWDSMRGRWDYDYVTSLCIDAGNPGSPLADEPLSIPDDPNNVYGKNIRINMGAYGGTAEASMPPLDWYSIADLTNDWAVDFNDLAVFVDYWLDSGRCIPSDLNRSRFVDFSDFAIFSRQWLDTPTAGPAITYQIDDCDLETERGLAVVGQSGELRFSVTVEGSFIHFEDTMVANCCSDELGLEMTVTDSLITIYETEYTPGMCLCICDYPVTATLGPFEPGIYILEVYEDWTGFIGSTIVIIE